MLLTTAIFLPCSFSVRMTSSAVFVREARVGMPVAGPDRVREIFVEADRAVPSEVRGAVRLGRDVRPIERGPDLGLLLHHRCAPLQDRCDLVVGEVASDAHGGVADPGRVGLVGEERAPEVEEDGVDHGLGCDPHHASSSSARHRVHDAVGSDAALRGAVGAVRLPLELVGGVGVGADRDPDSGLARGAEDVARRVEPLRTAVDLRARCRTPCTLRSRPPRRTPKAAGRGRSASDRCSDRARRRAGSPPRRPCASSSAPTPCAASSARSRRRSRRARASPRTGRARRRRGCRPRSP